MEKKTFAVVTFLFFILAVSCNKCNTDKAPTTSVKIEDNENVKIKIHRYEKALFAVDINNLKIGMIKLTPEYNFFIPESALNDSMSLLQMKSYLADPLIIALYDDCIQTFPDVKDIETKLGKALSYFKHYFPEKKIPKVYTCVSGLDYTNAVRYLDSVLIISLDMYMGSNYNYYKEMLGSVPLYVQKRFRRDFIVPDCMRQMALSIVDNSKENKRFIDQIIYQGKIQYFLDAMLPDTPDSLKMYYTPEQMDWCMKNESKIWSFLIDNKLLYSTDAGMLMKLCGDGPFTPVFSKTSPPKTGVWIGWQIVRAYMKNNGKITLQELFLDQDAQGILAKSKYKPRKE